MMNMEIIKNDMSSLLVSLIGLALTGVLTWLGVQLKEVFAKSSKEKLYLSLAATCAQAIEQIYKDLHGEEKLNKALEAFSEMLEVRGLSLSPLEMRMYLENAVGAFNSAFKKEAPAEDGEGEE